MARARSRRIALFALLAVIGGVLSAGVAAAVSGGGYQPSEQDCPLNADSNDAGQPTSWQPQSPVPGCHNFKVNVEDHNGGRYGQVWIDQEAQNENPHSGGFKVNTNGNGSGPGLTGTFDTKWQPFPPGSCGLFDLAIFPIELLFNTLNGNPKAPCNLPPPTPPSGPPSVSVNPQSGSPDGSIANLPQGAKVYVGADDNLDTGEHDGVDGNFGTKRSANGPSDGGAVIVDWHPAQVAAWLATLAAAPGAPGPFLSNPVPLVSTGFGSCADGICLGIYTAKTTVYQGGTNGERDVYNYSGKNWDPAACSSGSPADEQQCHGPNKGDPKTMDQYRKAEKQNVVAQPGVQVYEDPDPQGSPIGPYPLPAGYVGTCGITAGGGAAPAAPASPVTNSAGQLSVSTGC
jgi:hypothetical protein